MGIGRNDLWTLRKGRKLSSETYDNQLLGPLVNDSRNSPASPTRVLGKSSSEQNVDWFLCFCAWFLFAYPVAEYLFALGDAFWPNREGKRPPLMLLAAGQALMFTILLSGNRIKRKTIPKDQLQTTLRSSKRWMLGLGLLVFGMTLAARILHSQPSWLFLVACGVATPVSWLAGSSLLARSGVLKLPAADNDG